MRPVPTDSEGRTYTGRMTTRISNRRLPALVLVGLLPLCHVTPPAGADGSGGARKESSPWSEVDAAIDEQRLEEASRLVEQILGDARHAEDADLVARALLRRAELRIALHGYETAVEDLRAAEWPRDASARGLLHLGMAHSLRFYLQAYGWQIGQRERVVTDEEMDLDRWTREQIATAADRSFAAAWAARDAWGEQGLGDLADLFREGTYPERIRGTRRDVVAGLWTEWLRDSSTWSPAESNGVHRLDLEGLIAGNSPDDPSTAHPLARLAGILGELELWHQEAGRPEAAFEAFRSRLDALRSHFDTAADRARLSEALAQRLESLDTDLPWSSMGRFTLAEWTRGTDAPDREIRAREIALAGAEAHPASLGGEACRSLVAAIEAPEFQLSAMELDGPDRRSIQVDHRNLARLHFRAWRFDLSDLLASNDDAHLFPRWREIPDEVFRRTPEAEWSVDLAPTPDFRRHRTYVTPPLERPGLWVIAASAEPDFRDEGNRRAAVHLVLSDLVVELRTEGLTHDITVREGASGARVAGAEVELWRLDYRTGHEIAVRGRTRADGRVRLRDTGSDRGQWVVLARHRDQETVVQGVHRTWEHSGSQERSAALVYTDRAAYRPGQTVLWKAVAYRGRTEDGEFRVAPGVAGFARLLDANGEEVARADATTNEFGSASGELVIEPGRLLGAWRVEVSWGGSADIRVEEYERPAFEVEILEPEEALRLNRAAELRGEARYYFGLPVTDGSVAWRVSRTPVLPQWWGWWSRGFDTSSQIVAAGEAELDAEGRFRVEFVPEADEREAENGVSYRYELSADVTDAGGETRSGERGFRLGFVTIEASLRPAVEIGRAGEAFAVDVLRRDLDGAPRAGEGRWALLAVVVPDEPRMPSDREVEIPEGEEEWASPGDRLRPRWESEPPAEAVTRDWPDGDSLADGALTHGADGLATAELPGLDPGLYRLRYTTSDPWGAAVEAILDVRVHGSAPSAATAPPVGLPALLETAASSVEVGETATLVLGSGFTGQPFALELFRDGKAFSREERQATGSVETFEVPIEPRHRGGFTARMTMVRDHQAIQREVHVLVPWTDRELDVQLETFREVLRPGQAETWTVRVKGADDEEALAAGSAELLASMFDRSLDLFAPYQPPRVASLYPSRLGSAPLRVGLGHAGEVWSEQRDFGARYGSPSLRGAELTVISGYGIGGPGRRHRAMKSLASAMPQREMLQREQDVGAVEEMVVVAESAMAPAAPPPPPSPPAADGPPADGAGEGDALRSDFAETAFWEPHLVLGEDGTVAFEFEVPDSVTDWHVWVHAITRDLRGGSAHRTARTVRDLMVRPALPRFLRQGDRAEIEVVVDNAGEVPLAGTVELDVVDPETGRSLAGDFGLDRTSAPFELEPVRSRALRFGMRAPDRLGPVEVVARARAGGLADGEKRTLPILPSRFRVVQSRFAALGEDSARTLRFDDLVADDDPTRADEQLVVTVDAQLFTTVLRALPYLVEYPYECTEQTLNRFLSSAIVTSVFADHPAIASLAEKLASRETRLEAWEADDPNRAMLLAETPWVGTSRGGDDDLDRLIPILDPAVAAAQQRTALRKLEKAQTSSGGFPWWPGGPPSPYMTLYLLQGFSRAIEVGVGVPRPMVEQAWRYLHRHWVDELAREAIERDCCWEQVTFLAFVLSAYEDEVWTGGVFSAEDRRRMLDFGFEHWKDHSPLLKSLLARALHRAGRSADATLVWESVMDSAKTDPDLGTYWAPEDRAWLWYNDTVETHAVALRTLTELAPDDPRRSGLVHWLLLDKKLGHWKSTRATAEAIWALVHALDRDGLLGQRDVVRVRLGERDERWVFEPDEPETRRQLVLEGDEVGPDVGEIRLERETEGLVFASATWQFSTERLPEKSDGDLFSVERTLFRRVLDGDAWTLRPLVDGERIEVGDEVEVRLDVVARHAAEFVHLRDPRGAGFEPTTLVSGYRWKDGVGVYEEIRDSGANYFFDWLPAGEVSFRHRLRATTAGTYRVAPAVMQSMYAPEFGATSAGHEVGITPAE